MGIILIIIFAVIIDLALGDPPNAYHPVAWMGWIISKLERVGMTFDRTGQFIFGIFMTLFTVALFTIPVYGLFLVIGVLLDPLGVIALFLYPLAGAIFLKSTFTISGLRRTARQIRIMLEEKDLDETRRELRALVSRNTSGLAQPLMVSAAVESVAEGLCDSVIAPLFYYLLLGLPGAIAYRVVNTLDSMIGYRGEYEYLGKFPARLDDVLNFVPARLSALLLILAATFKKAGGRAGQVALDDHRQTASPNAGWPMAAMAGALNIRLHKPGHYSLGDGKDKLEPKTIDASVSLFSIASAVWIGICCVWGGIAYVTGS
ncbi:MAG: cobalamin biosynthesis protein [Dehalococcoidales bacterium]|nr:cobalamin biosynthesis protein [Dehalococcoidales bacterium]